MTTLTHAAEPIHDLLLESAEASLTRNQWLCKAPYGGTEALATVWVVPGQEATYSSPPEPPEAELLAAWLPRHTASGTILTPIPEEQLLALEDTLGINGLFDLVEDQYPAEEPDAP